MIRVFLSVAMVVTGLAFFVSAGASQDAKKGDQPPAKAKGYTPAGWKALNLTKEQVLKFGDIHGTYKGKIKTLEDQIADLKVQEKQELVKLLTADQKKQLQTLIIPDEAPAKDAPPKDGSKK
jgi:Spy/CpxP family protein refolding chaperone